jgi:hypothetical protein
MTTILSHQYGGRLGNQIIRNIAVSLIAEKFDLQVTYSSQPWMDELGIPLFCGSKVYSETKPLTEANYFSVYESEKVEYNLNPNQSFFQTTKIIKLIYQYLQHKKDGILEKNIFKDRIPNQDVFVHIRLTDVKQYNPGLHYYANAIQNVPFHHIYISTDEPSHEIIQQLCKMYPHATLMNKNEVQTIQFASTCKYIILSHGSFSSIIGYLSYFSDVHYPNHTIGKIWYGDLFCIPSWKKCSI